MGSGAIGAELKILKVHRLICGSLCPLGCNLAPSFFGPKLDCQCLLIEASSRLILVDTGLGSRDMIDPKRLGLSRKLFRPIKDIQAPAIEQIKKLGFKPEDVTDIIPTHLDWDHAGGIVDFPKAKIHINQIELEDAQKPSKNPALHRYRQEQLQGPIRWEPYDINEGESWYGFDTVREFHGLPPEILLVNLPGHTRGHVGVAVESPDGWILHAGDAYYHYTDLNEGLPGMPKPPPGLRFIQWMSHIDSRRARQTQVNLRKLRHELAIRIICGHDGSEWDKVITQKPKSSV